MPLYADFYAYGSTPVFSPSHYSALLYLGSSGSNFSSRLGSYTSPSSRSPLPTAPRLLPPPVSRRPRRFAPPSLPTISEASGSPILSSSPRLRARYTAPRPIRIDTADIDVTSPRNRGPFDRSSDGTGDRKGSPKERAGTIRRGRTVVRLHTRRLKDGPPPSALAAVAKTPGERLAEKFYIHDSPSRESPTRQKSKVDESATPSREERRRKEGATSFQGKKEEKSEDGESVKEADSVYDGREPKVVKDDSDEELKDESHEVKSKVGTIDGWEKREGGKIDDEPKETQPKNKEKAKILVAKIEAEVSDGTAVETVVEKIKNEALSIIKSETIPVVGEILSPSDEKDIRVPKLIVGEVSIEVKHAPRPPRSKPVKRLRMQVEVVVDGQEGKETSEKIKKIPKFSSETGEPSPTTETPIAIHSVPSPSLDAAAPDKFATSKSGGDPLKLWTEESGETKSGESPTIGKTEKSLRTGDGRDALGRKCGGVSTPAAKKESAQVTKKTPAIAEKGASAAEARRKGEVAKTGVATPSMDTSDHTPNASLEDIPLKRGAPPASTQKDAGFQSLAGSGVQGLKKAAKPDIEPLKLDDAPKNVVPEKRVVPESPKSSSPDTSVTGATGTKLAVESVATKKPDKDSSSTNAAKVSKPAMKTNEMKKENLVGAKLTTNATDLQKLKKIIKEPDVKDKPQPIEIKGPSSVAKVAGASVSPDAPKDQKTTAQKEKANEAAGTPSMIDANKKTEATNKGKEIKSIADSVLAAKTKQTSAPVLKKERNATEPIPLILDEDAYDQKNFERSISSVGAEIPVKMMKVIWPQKGPSPKVIEKPPGLLAKLVESEKMLQAQEPGKKQDAAKITEIGKTKENPPGSVSEKSVVTGAPKLTKADGKKDETEPPKQQNSQDTSSLCQKSKDQITPETPTKDKTQAVNKIVGIKTDFKKEPETGAAKTKRQPPSAKISQELRKTGTAVTTDLKGETVNKEVTKGDAETISSLGTSETTDSSSTSQTKTGVVKDKKPILASSPGKVGNKSTAEPVAAVVPTKTESQGKAEKKEPTTKPSDKDAPRETSVGNREKTVTSAKEDKAEKSQVSELKAVKEEVKTEIPAITGVPPMAGEKEKEEDDDSESEEESEEETDEETEGETETDTEDEEERQLVEEAIRRASTPGTSAAPAKSLPRFRDYNVRDFLFLRVLGKGSFGKVFLAALRDTDRHYAVKCLKKQSVIEEDDVECTLIERKVLSLATSHPYLCHLFCTFQSETHLFFVMEYLNGGDLMFHIQRGGRFEQERAQFYAAEIVSGLKFLHKKGIVYRDLKLDNILLDYDGHVRIADFGMCKLQIFLDRTADSFCGTPDYIAPEIIKGYRYNQTVDWWSFGVLLYEMLVGQSPFTGCDEDELFWSICNETPLFPRFLTREACDVLARLLNKDSDRRLGAQGCPAGDVCDQPFFRSIDWGRLERKELVPPFKPALKHPMDLQYFETTFTCEKAKLTPINKQVINPEDQSQFEGFSYTNPNATD